MYKYMPQRYIIHITIYTNERKKSIRYAVIHTADTGLLLLLSVYGKLAYVGLGNGLLRDLAVVAATIGRHRFPDIPLLMQDTEL